MATNANVAQERRSEYAAVASGVMQMCQIDATSMWGAGAAVMNSQTSKQVKELARAFQGGIAGPKTAAINRRLVQRAQRATVSSYAASRRGGGPSGYRKGDATHPRYSGGMLRDALRDDSFVHSDANNISFGNVELLNSRAKQWSRLNFGAGQAGAASPASRPFPLRISNVVVADLGLKTGPRPGFLLPRGYFIGGAFYLGRSTDDSAVDIPEPRGTKGIRAEHFLDNGIAMIAKYFWPAYQDFLRTLVAEGISKVRVTNTVTTNKIPAKAPRIPRL